MFANLTGHDSHGVLRLPWYAAQITSGKLVPAARPIHLTKTRRGAISAVDAQNGWGQAGAHLATDAVIEIARQFGIASVAIRNCNHIGRLGIYVERVARAGLIGFMTCNSNPTVAAYGGRERLFGTNPIAYGLPRALEHTPIIIDYATSVIAEGKLRVARDTHKPVPLGVILDRDGAPTQNAHDFYDGGMLLPMAGYKGYGLSFMADVLGGILSLKSATCLPEYSGNNGTLIIAIDPEFFLTRESYLDQIERMCARIKASKVADGFEEVMLPGEPELRQEQLRQRDGIALPRATHDALIELSRSLGLK
jgi:uncharacterized oxidoreductase